LKLLTSVFLRSNQRQLVKYFKHYNIDYDNLELPERKTKDSVAHLIKHFDPR
jgi:hypothetical protein